MYAHKPRHQHLYMYTYAYAFAHNLFAIAPVVCILQHKSRGNCSCAASDVSVKKLQTTFV